MPVRKAYAAAKGHVWDNLLLWIGVFAVIGVLTLAVHWGALAALSFMLVGIFVMVASEKGFVLTHESPTVDDGAV